MGNGGNKHAGLSIGLHSKYITPESVVGIYAPSEPVLRGRLSAIRFKTLGTDITIINMYPPPPCAGGKAWDLYCYILEKCALLITRLPSRTTPILCTDANNKLGYDKANGSITRMVSPAVGDVQPEVGSIASTKFVELLEATGMAAINTFYPAGHTFFSATSPARSRISYVCAPAEVLAARVHSCKVLHKEGKKLQLIKKTQPADHFPLAVRLHLKLHIEKKNSCV